MPRKRGKKAAEKDPEAEPVVVSHPDRATALLRWAGLMQQELKANEEKGWGFTIEDRGRVLMSLRQQIDQMDKAILSDDMPRFVQCLIDLANMALIVAETVPAEHWPEAGLPAFVCPHISSDGSVCFALDAHVADVVGRVETLRRQQKAEEEATIRFSAKFKGASLNADGELSVALTPNVADPWALHQESVTRKGRTVNVGLVFPVEEAPAAVPADQQALPLADTPAPEPVDMIACRNPACRKIVRTEGAEPGGICGFCLDGELAIEGVIPLTCSICRQPQELATARPGDDCTLCAEGRYMSGLPTAGPSQPEGGDDVSAPVETEEKKAEPTCEGDQTADAKPTEECGDKPAGECKKDVPPAESDQGEA